MEINLTIWALLKIHQWLPITYGTRLKSLPGQHGSAHSGPSWIPPAKDKRFLLLSLDSCLQVPPGDLLCPATWFSTKLFSYPRTQLRPHETRLITCFLSSKDSSSRQPSLTSTASRPGSFKTLLLLLSSGFITAINTLYVII